MTTKKKMALFVAFSALSVLLPLPFAGAAFTTVGSSVSYHRQPRTNSNCCSYAPLFLTAADEHGDTRAEHTDDTAKITPRLGLLRFVDPEVDSVYASEIDTTETGLAWLSQPGLMWEAAIKDAEEKKIPVDEYIQQIKTNLQDFAKSDIVYERQELLGHLNKAFEVKGGFTFLLGGKNLGKSKILESLANKANTFSESKLLVLYIDGSLYQGRLNPCLANGLARLAVEKLTGKPDPSDWLEVLEKFAYLGCDTAVDIMKVVLTLTQKQTKCEAIFVISLDSGLTSFSIIRTLTPK